MAEKKTQEIEKSMTILTGKTDKEPIVEAGDDYACQMAKALNWYNATWDEKAYQRAAIQYVKKAGLKGYVECVSNADFLEVRMIGVVGRLMIRGQFVSLADVEKIMIRLDDLKRKYVKKTVVSDSAPKKSIQDHIQEAARTHIAEFEGAIDDLIEKGTEFSAKSYLVSNEVSGVVAKKISDYFGPVLAELKAVKKDEELQEAYSHLSASKMKKLIALVESFVNDSDQQKVSATVRKPRKKKEKPASKIVEKVKYMKEFAELKLKSINPKTIVGASELWVYQPVKRKLTVFRAAEGGLSVKGQTLVNFDISLSETKTLRKPEEFFKTALNKRAINGAWKAIKAKISKPRGRLNEEMVLLAAH